MGRRWGLFATIWLLILTSVYLADRFVRDVFLTDDTPRAVTVGCGEGQEMYGVELYGAVRLAVVDEGLSHHEAGRRFGIDRRTVKKMLSYSAPPGYRRTKPVRRPKLDGFTGIVDAILEADTDPEVPRKQRHTAHRIFERLRDEHGFTGG